MPLPCFSAQAEGRIPRVRCQECPVRMLNFFLSSIPLKGHLSLQKIRQGHPVKPYGHDLLREVKAEVFSRTQWGCVIHNASRFKVLFRGERSRSEYSATLCPVHTDRDSSHEEPRQ